MMSSQKNLLNFKPGIKKLCKEVAPNTKINDSAIVRVTQLIQKLAVKFAQECVWKSASNNGVLNEEVADAALDAIIPGNLKKNAREEAIINYDSELVDYDLEKIMAKAKTDQIKIRKQKSVLYADGLLQMSNALFEDISLSRSGKDSLTKILLDLSEKILKEIRISGKRDRMTFSEVNDAVKRVLPESLRHQAHREGLEMVAFYDTGSLKIKQENFEVSGNVAFRTKRKQTASETVAPLPEVEFKESRLFLHSSEPKVIKKDLEETKEQSKVGGKEVGGRIRTGKEMLFEEANQKRKNSETLFSEKAAKKCRIRSVYEEKSTRDKSSKPNTSLRRKSSKNSFEKLSTKKTKNVSFDETGGETIQQSSHLLSTRYNGETINKDTTIPLELKRILKLPNECSSQEKSETHQFLEVVRQISRAFLSQYSNMILDNEVMDAICLRLQHITERLLNEIRLDNGEVGYQNVCNAISRIFPEHLRSVALSNIRC